MIKRLFLIFVMLAGMALLTGCSSSDTAENSKEPPKTALQESLQATQTKGSADDKIIDKKVQAVNAIYVGLIDKNSFECTVDGKAEAFRLPSASEKIKKAAINEGDKVTVYYHIDEIGRNIVKKIEKHIR